MTITQQTPIEDKRDDRMPVGSTEVDFNTYMRVTLFMGTSRSLLVDTITKEKPHMLGESFNASLEVSNDKYILVREDGRRIPIGENLFIWDRAWEYTGDHTEDIKNRYPGKVTWHGAVYPDGFYPYSALVHKDAQGKSRFYLFDLLEDPLLIAGAKLGVEDKVRELFRGLPGIRARI